MIRTHKIRMYPNKSQEKILQSYFGYSRYCYNRGLAKWNELIDNKQKCSEWTIRDYLKSTREGWEKDIKVMVLDTACEDLAKAFDKCRSMHKRPKFKSKRKAKKSFRFYRKCDNSIKIVEDKFYLTRSIKIKLAENLRFAGVIKTATVVEEYGKYFISISVELSTPIQRNPKNESIGLDFGLKHFITLSNSEKVEYPERLLELEKKKRFYSRQFSLKKDNSNNQLKAKAKLLAVYEKIDNFKKDFLHKLSSDLSSNYSMIAIEDLSMKNMRKFGKRWRKKMDRLPWYYFTQLLAYKTINFKKIDRFSPTSQVCSSCGQLHPEMKDLKQRQLICDCGYTIDRDVNAAKNILTVTLNN